ncbi:unnamed protein product [Schistosoma margrebowiei]|uniref:Uncharacterized protein n=1 Tax=Schistosoma margrebowiei TaxID=48269 RepID=A0A3P8A1A5_9TREM|nr:unnamed protein product [Schistosoma margrebowiei]
MSEHSTWVYLLHKIITTVSKSISFLPYSITFNICSSTRHPRTYAQFSDIDTSGSFASGLRYTISIFSGVMLDGVSEYNPILYFRNPSHLDWQAWNKGPCCEKFTRLMLKGFVAFLFAP